MNILLIGSGGREDALCWRLSQSPSCEKLVAAPGNPGMERWAGELRGVDVNDPTAIVELAKKVAADLVVVGPEAPLCAGAGDALRAAGIACFGPDKAAARLEGSKGFTKQVCTAASIPTARYLATDDKERAKAALPEFGFPVVIKEDGLAAGKGVTIATTSEEAEAAIDASDDALVIEEFLEGEEASLFALVDGDEVRFLASAQDHKRIGEGDTGPNTGGMGAYSPAPVLTDELRERAMEEIIRPTAKAMVDAGTPFCGVLYAGLMLTEAGPKLIEYNVRFGDPECQAIMPRIAGDFAKILHAVATGKLAELGEIELEEAHVITVVVAAKGYPGTPAKGATITGIDAAEENGAIVFQAGSRREGDQLVGAGGRVLNVTAAGATLSEARNAAYDALEKIDFADAQYRKDIGWRELERAG